MEGKNVTKVRLSTFLLILAIIIIIIMSVFIYKLNDELTISFQNSHILQEQLYNLDETVSDLSETVNDLQEKMNTISSNTLKDNNVVSSETTNEITNTTNNSSSSASNSKVKAVVLDGKYTYAGEAGDTTWDFSKDGKAALGGNISVMQGTYQTTSANYVEIHYTQIKIWDDETGEATITPTDKYEYISIDNEDKLYLTNSYGTFEIERIGDVVSGQFE